MLELHRRRKQDHLHLAPGQRPHRRLDRPNIFRERPLIHSQRNRFSPTLPQSSQQLRIGNSVFLHCDSPPLQRNQSRVLIQHLKNLAPRIRLRYRQRDRNAKLSQSRNRLRPARHHRNPAQRRNKLLSRTYRLRLPCQDSCTHSGEKEDAVESPIEQRAREIRDFCIRAEGDLLRRWRNHRLAAVVRYELSHLAGAAALQCQHPRTAKPFLALLHATQTINVRPSCHAIRAASAGNAEPTLDDSIASSRAGSFA